MELELFIAMLNRAEVPFEMNQFDGARIVVRITAGGPHDEGPIVGYGMFYTEFTFNVEGMLTQVGIWE